MKKQLYFISDVHLGLHPQDESLIRERLLVELLNEIRHDASEIYLLGDIFDFWHEYKKVVPRGFTRFLGTIASITDSGIPVHFFTGNHDVWVYDYLPHEIGVTLHRKHIEKEINGKKFYIGHGDGLSPEDWKYRMLKGFFTDNTLQWLFARIHPNLAMWFGHTWSKKSRYSKGIEPESYLGHDKEHQVVFARKMLQKHHFDYFVFGHRHLPMDLVVNNNSHVINLGDWIFNFTYGIFDGEKFTLKSAKPERNENILHMRIDK